MANSPRSPGPLIAVASAVSPSRASRAAVTPNREQRPAWSGLVIEPKLRFSPASVDAAALSACTVVSASRSRRLAAAVAPKVLNVACQPAS